MVSENGEWKLDLIDILRDHLPRDGKYRELTASVSVDAEGGVRIADLLVRDEVVDPPPPPLRIRFKFEGVEGSTEITEDAGKVWTAFGNARIDTSLGGR